MKRSRFLKSLGVAMLGAVAIPNVKSSKKETPKEEIKDNILAFKTDGVELMRITSSGTIGISTQSPSSTLEVYQLHV